MSRTRAGDSNEQMMQLAWRFEQGRARLLKTDNTLCMEAYWHVTCGDNMPGQPEFHVLCVL